MKDINNGSADRLTFWRNWYTASRQLPDELRLAWLDAVLDFAFEGREPSPATNGSGITEAIAFQAVSMVRATIEISRKRKQSGSKGGASRKQAQAKAKQRRSKAKADRKQVKEHVQEQEQEHNAKSITATARVRGKTPPTLDQFIEGGKLAGVPESFAREFYAEVNGNGWRDSDGRYIGNWRMYLRSAYADSQKKMRGACEKDLLARAGQLDSNLDMEGFC